MTEPIWNTWLCRDAERPQKRLCESTRRDACRGLARAGPLEDVADVGVAELQDAGEIGMAGTRQVDLIDLSVDQPRVHALLPVGVVTVLDQENDRAAEGAAVPDAAANDRPVGLDLHPPAAAVPQLAARKVGVDVGRLQSRPAGRPSSTATSQGPCDSPAVVNLSSMD